MKPFLESCCTSLEEVLEAQTRGADRIELCEDLSVGGVTPSRQLLESVLEQATIPVNVLIRPRGGSFVFTEDEVNQMVESIEMCRKTGKVNAVVIGALNDSGDVCIPVMKRLIDCARPDMKITFHRAFDVCRDPLSAFDDILSLGCERLLSSGHETDAFQGRFLLRDLIKKADSRMVILCGGGVRPNNIGEIEACTGASEFHASSSFWKSM